jgi:alpha-L-rhamnosidase
MFGACVRQLFSSILGIGQADGSAGFAELRIAPQIPRNLPWASGNIRIPAGEVTVAWKKEENHIHFHIELPENTSARFVYDGGDSPLSPGVNDLTF